MMTGFNTPCTKEPAASHQRATEDQAFGSSGSGDVQEREEGPGMMTGCNTPCTKKPPGSHQGATEDQTFGSNGPSDAQEREEGSRTDDRTRNDDRLARPLEILKIRYAYLLYLLT